MSVTAPVDAEVKRQQDLKESLLHVVKQEVARREREIVANGGSGFAPSTREELEAAGKAKLGSLNLHTKVENPEAYVRLPIRGAIVEQLQFVLEFKEITKAGRYALQDRNRLDNTPSVDESLWLLFEEQTEGIEPPVPPVDFMATAALLDQFLKSCTPLQREIVESRLEYLHNPASSYADAIASDLGLTTLEVVSELEQLQRQFLRFVNARRRSRNNRDFPALKPQPIARVERPTPQAITMQELAAKIDARKRRQDRPATIYKFPAPTRLADVA